MILLLAALQTMAAAEAPLTVRNLDAPFCYATGGERSWRIAPQPLPSSLQVRLAIFREGQLLQESAGPEVRFEDLRLSIDRQGVLRVVSQTARRPFDLEVRLLRGTQLIQIQTLRIRPAPPTRPITYYADFGDDLINIFGAGLGSGPPLLHHQIREGGPRRAHLRCALRTAVLSTILKALTNTSGGSNARASPARFSGCSRFRS